MQKLDKDLKSLCKQIILESSIRLLLLLFGLLFVPLVDLFAMKCFVSLKRTINFVTITVSVDNIWMKGMLFYNSTSILKQNFCYVLIFLETGTILGIDFFSVNVLKFSLCYDCLYSTQYFYIKPESLKNTCFSLHKQPKFSGLTL